jgi:hypothetical protein
MGDDLVRIGVAPKPMPVARLTRFEALGYRVLVCNALFSFSWFRRHSRMKAGRNQRSWTSRAMTHAKDKDEQTFITDFVEDAVIARSGGSRMSGGCGGPPPPILVTESPRIGDPLFPLGRH